MFLSTFYRFSVDNQISLELLSSVTRAYGHGLIQVKTMGTLFIKRRFFNRSVDLEALLPGYNLGIFFITGRSFCYTGGLI